jgi:hypothetical protein
MRVRCCIDLGLVPRVTAWIGSAVYQPWLGAAKAGPAAPREDLTMLTTMIAFRAAMTRSGEMSRPQRGEVDKAQSQSESPRR